MQFHNHKISIYIPLIIALGFLLIYVLGLIWPDTFWSIHFLFFLPSGLKYGIPLVVAIIIFYIYFKKDKNSIRSFKLTNTYTVIISLISFIIFYNLDIVNDYYGDAKNFAPYLDQKLTSFKEGFWKDLFSIQFKTGHARWGVFNLYSAIAYILKINMFQTFKLMDALFGAGFILISITAIKTYIKNSRLAITLILLICTAPLLVIFCGHIETYGLVLFLQLTWIYLYVKAFQERKVILLYVLIPLLIICIRYNTPSFLLAPALILGFIHHYFYDNSKIRSLFTAKKLFFYILIPLVLIGFFMYFFVLEDYNDSRSLNANDQDIDRLFLPILSPDPPLDTYNLFSWNHISDFFMVFFFWSPGILFLISIVLVYQKKLKWNTPLINVIVFTFILITGFLFMINPLMSLPMDWDLYTQSFPLILMLLILIFNQQKETVMTKKITSFSLLLQILSIPIFVVLMNKTMHSYRIESVGVRVYKTYYQHSDSFMLYALQMLEGKDRYIARKNNLLKKLKPYTRGRIDQNYAALLLDEGINAFANKNYKKSRELLLIAESYAPYLKLTHEFLEKVNPIWMEMELPISNKNKMTADSLINRGLEASRKNKFFNKALRDFQRASYYNPYAKDVFLYRMETYFFQKKYKKALVQTERLIDLEYPSKQNALRFGVHCALEAEEYQIALQYAQEYINYWTQDLFMKEIYDRLKNEDSVSELKYKFAKK
ncbi:hypothetical protein [Aquimarina sp. 2201CG5-10]|uniref:tetratricopeptide repeat protein n=1 Tax=Aquimarina callyspongiae TaxID=3098150 RepID=UPI002AB3FA2E|nr:hypothetical protein [Aquimarina sp. 2201CG5-10]MDY8135850.1 hypothetical protein [Aquimarina sp. 2201CG5-10]